MRHIKIQCVLVRQVQQDGLEFLINGCCFDLRWWVYSIFSADYEKHKEIAVFFGLHPKGIHSLCPSPFYTKYLEVISCDTNAVTGKWTLGMLSAWILLLLHTTSKGWYEYLQWHDPNSEIKVLVSVLLPQI